MLKKLSRALLTILVLTTAAPTPVPAQGLDTFGSRASSMAAFVAVADDASAVAWNPAGLLTGPFFNVVLDLGRSTDSPDDPPVATSAAGRTGTTFLALGLPPLGLSYSRLRVATAKVTAPAAETAAGRQDEHVVVQTLVATQLGATVLQSLGDYLTVGVTLKLVQGRVGTGRAAVSTWNEAFARAERAEREGSTTGDADVGAMLAVARVRAGLVVRHLAAPGFESREPGAARMTLDRHVRMGVAWGDRWPGRARTIVAVDGDLTRVMHSTGERRDVAAGVERWLHGYRVGVRGGLRVSAVGDAHPVATGGVSYALRGGTYVDAHVSRGGDVRSWGIGARVTY
jgi:hypothetical protein